MRTSSESSPEDERNFISKLCIFHYFLQDSHAFAKCSKQKVETGIQGTPVV